MPVEQSSPRVAAETPIVVVNWNGGNLLRACLASIDATVRPDEGARVVVVDNGSTDDSLDWLLAEERCRETRGTPLQVMPIGRNLGFGAANNHAMRSLGSPFVLLLNADAELTPGVLRALRDRLEADPSLAAAAPRVVTPDEQPQPNTGRNPQSAWDLLLAGSGLDARLPATIRRRLMVGDWGHDRPRLVPFASATAIMVRRSAFEAVDGFDERFFMYAEDRDLCWRLQGRGWHILFDPAVTVRHHGHAFSKRRWTPVERRVIGLEVTLDFWSSALPPRRAAANSLAHAAILASALALRTLSRRDSDDLRQLLRIHGRFLRTLARG